MAAFEAADLVAFELARTALVTLVAAALTCERAAFDCSTAFLVGPVAVVRTAFVARVAAAVARDGYERGSLVCGTGIGMAITACKVPGIRAALCHDTYSAAQGVLHDDVNVLALGSRVIGQSLAEDLVRTFVDEGFTRTHRAMPARMHHESYEAARRLQKAREATVEDVVIVRGRLRLDRPRPHEAHHFLQADCDRLEITFKSWRSPDESERERI